MTQKATASNYRSFTENNDMKNFSIVKNDLDF